MEVFTPHVGLRIRSCSCLPCLSEDCATKDWGRDFLSRWHLVFGCTRSSQSILVGCARLGFRGHIDCSMCDFVHALVNGVTVSTTLALQLSCSSLTVGHSKY
eukprot:63029-Amphidinium_carterae.1